ncbi:MAG: Serine--tRNA ligase [Alphaproteobacteria bacterium MarineAlpha5_Bin8]|nr:MAG: Serine--tRNA ligase [Alphaproteobacteria bacterium MarineAlpha5_Bin7]PPR46966.1 MAG: Serine--tRNA ligase [Alphaproteobacteria bacterium MarineAlpha5_Bin8]PPR53453.1 MAG: Serine--tRNA ligase [Alphaproteobacteria bacterium MarineAlpha5_Bin6]|tara:strand:- start:645 stop:1907 length:1263 start_codon:yes stop_codon:yes gene_type:complete
MLDIDFIRKNPSEFDNALKSRNVESISKRIIKIDEEKRNTQTILQNILAEKNLLSKKIGIGKSKKENVDSEIKKVEKLNNEISSLKELEKIKIDELTAILNRIPNIPAKDVPIGDNENDNIEYKKYGNKPKFNFIPKKHFELGENLNLMNFELSSKLSGSRFVVLKGIMSKLERAIATFMLDKHTLENGYTEISVPFLVKDSSLYGTGQLPKFAEDLFTAGENHWLIPTAEVPLTNLVREQILLENELPSRFTAYTPCFRSEAGAAGKDTRGMLRQHQFTKVELVSVTTPDQSEKELERMLNSAESILRDLEIHYRIVTLCTGDMGFAAKKTYDIEVWLPGENAYREISSCSNCGDFQSRRMNTKIKKDNKNIYAHTLNGSGLAVGRTLIAILENYQTQDGNVLIPECLQKYFDNKKTLI